MNRITKISIVLYGTIIFLIMVHLITILLQLKDNGNAVIMPYGQNLVIILFAFLSIGITNRYIRTLKDQEEKEREVGKNRFKLIDK